MYLSKETVLKAYFVLSKATPSILNNFSAIQYFVATDKFFKKNNAPCDSSNTKSKTEFYGYVEDVIGLDDGHYLSSFKTIYVGSKSISSTVSSNFFSGSSVEHSNNTPNQKFDYPKKGALIYALDGKVFKEESYYSNLSDYLRTDIEKAALAMWLLRRVDLQMIDNPDELRGALLLNYSQLLVDTLLPLSTDWNSIYNSLSLSLSDEIAFIGSNDIIPPKHRKINDMGFNIAKYNIYLTAISTKPFLLLAGISGTGKSRIVRELAFMTCPKELQDEDGTTPGNYCMIEVKPNWHDSTELLGYYSSFNGGGYRFTKFDRFVVKAWLNPDVPFFVCLDEMNLAPVEQYFAEFLSVLETRSRDKRGDVVTGALVDKQYFKDDTKMTTEFGLDKGDDWTIKVRTDLVNKGLTLPPNLIIIGTVNMDDTTYQFSRKVIDRAMTIEMNGGELSQMFGNSNSLKYRSDEDVVKLGMFKAPYINADEVIEHYQGQAQIIKEKLPEKLEAVNTALKDTPFQVSYRVLNELVIYLGALMDEATAKGEAIDDDALPALIDQAMDQITLMKILPRIEGDEDMFRRSGGTNVLKTLQSLFPEDSDSYRKLKEMADRLDRTEFTRFWP